LFYGGSHEKKRRPGTENVAGAVGLAKTLEIADRRMAPDINMLSELAEYFIDRITSVIPDVYLNGSRQDRIPPTVNLGFKGVDGESVVIALDLEGVAVSSGSACTSGTTEPSHVLTAMGIPADIARGAIRFSMGRTTTRKQLDFVLSKLTPIIERLRAMSPVYGKN